MGMANMMFLTVLMSFPDPFNMLAIALCAGLEVFPVPVSFALQPLAWLSIRVDAHAAGPPLPRRSYQTLSGHSCGFIRADVAHLVAPFSAFTAAERLGYTPVTTHSLRLET